MMEYKNINGNQIGKDDRMGRMHGISKSSALAADLRYLRDLLLKTETSISNSLICKAGFTQVVDFADICRYFLHVLRLGERNQMALRNSLISRIVSDSFRHLRKGEAPVCAVSGVGQRKRWMPLNLPRLGNHARQHPPPGSPAKSTCAVFQELAQCFVELTFLPGLPALVAVFRPAAASVASFIANGVVAPIGMAAFPPVKAIEPPRLADQPASARPQIHIPTADEANKFEAVPNIGVRHADLDHRRPRRDYSNDGRPHCHRAARGQRGDDHGQTNNSAIL